MNKEHLTLVWKWTSISCVLFLIASVVSIQGGSEFAGKLFGDVLGKVDDNRPAVGYFAAIVGGALFLISSSSLALYAKRHGTAWHNRVPVVWLDGLRTSAWEGQFFQGFMLLIFVGLPISGISKCIVEAEIGDICEQDTSHFYKGSETTLLWPPTSADPKKQMRLRREGAGDEACKNGIQIFPRIGTPVLIYGIPVLAGSVALLGLGLTFRPRPRLDARNPVDDGAGIAP